MAPMIGAGKKNTNNQFSGVLMGDVKAKADSSVALTGLYGYQNGIQTFSLTEDGKAKFGASGSGQIQIDGKSGIIQSGNYVIDNNTGMKIDLTDGKIDAYNFKLTSSKITINSAEDVKNYFTIKGSGKIKTISYDFAMNGDKITPVVINYKEGEEEIFNKILINIGNDSYYLQTLNYNESTKKEAGLRIDLQNGSLTAYSGFNLTAINPQVKVNTSDETDVSYRGILTLDAKAGQYPLKLELGDATPFKLSWAGYLFTTKLQATGGTIGGWEIGPNSLSSNNIILTTKDSSNGSAISVGAVEMTNKKYTYIPAGAKEGNDIGDFVKTDGGYYKIVSDSNPYYEQTLNTETYVGGVLIKSNGSVQMSNLILDGRNVKWGYVPAYKPNATIHASGGQLVQVITDAWIGTTGMLQTVKKSIGCLSVNTKAPNFINKVSVGYDTEWHGCWRS